MKNEDYKRLAKMESAAMAQRAELMETLKDSYQRAVNERDEESAAELCRKIRNKLLEESDSSMIFDRMGLVVPSGTTFTAWLEFLRGLGRVLSNNWAIYRKQLRDIPEQPGFPFDVVFPEKPE